MLQRKFYNTLLTWKNSKKNECLLVNGARQVGKTYIVEAFGRAEYEKLVAVDFIRNPEYKAIFEGSLEPAELFKRFSLYVPEFSIVPGSTLLFLDEIQACRKARTALKFLAARDDVDVIASGSLLGIHYKGDSDDVPEEELSIPVGYERELQMHSLDFEEYLWAKGVSGETLGLLRAALEKGERLDGALIERYQQHLREYLVVGGMPAVVNEFLATNNFQTAHAEQEKILASYSDDIDKYATNVEKPKIRDVYLSIPRQLAKEYTKFQYKTVERNGSARKYGNSLSWLVDAGLAETVSNVSLPCMPLRSYEKPEEFKLYASDIGLATCMFGFETQAMLYENSLKGPAKGGIYENLVFDLLSKRGKKLFYFKRANNAQEIEFLLESTEDVVPVEVKAGNGPTLSLNAFIGQYNPPVAYKLTSGKMGRENTKVTLPQFMAMFL